MLKKLFYFILLPLIIILLFLGVWLGMQYWTWSHHKLSTPSGSILFDVKRGDTPAIIAKRIRDGGGDLNETFFVLFTKFNRLDKSIRTGSYEITSDDTAVDLVRKLTNGINVNRRLVFVEGKTFKDYLALLNNNQLIKHTLEGLSEADIAEKLHSDHERLDGLLFPATYVVEPGDSDLDILRRAYETGQKRLKLVWDNRDAKTPYKNPYELLIMASIIEKESASHLDRSRIAGVFTNRLRKGMKLQTDPTIIYALGDQYTGKLTRENMKFDSPWNTYLYKGLPPGPISNPGVSSLEAAAHPEEHDYLFFVASRNGRSEFAKDYDQHKMNIQTFLKSSDDSPTDSSDTQADASDEAASDSEETDTSDSNTPESKQAPERDSSADPDSAQDSSNGRAQPDGQELGEPDAPEVDGSDDYDYDIRE